MRIETEVTFDQRLLVAFDHRRLKSVAALPAAQNCEFWPPTAVATFDINSDLWPSGIGHYNSIWLKAENWRGREMNIVAFAAESELRPTRDCSSTETVAVNVRSSGGM